MLPLHPQNLRFLQLFSTFSRQIKGITCLKFHIYLQLAEQERITADLMAQLEQHKSESMSRRMVREAHQLVATGLGEMDYEMTMQYVMDIIKLLHTYRVKKSAAQQQPQQVHYSPTATAAASSSSSAQQPVYHEMAAAVAPPQPPHPPAPSTPRSSSMWGSATPTSGRPEVTRREDIFSPTFLQTLTQLNQSPTTDFGRPW